MSLEGPLLLEDPRQLIDLSDLDGACGGGSWVRDAGCWMSFPGLREGQLGPKEGRRLGPSPFRGSVGNSQSRGGGEGRGQDLQQDFMSSHTGTPHPQTQLCTDPEMCYTHSDTHTHTQQERTCISIHVQEPGTWTPTLTSALTSCWVGCVLAE